MYSLHNFSALYISQRSLEKNKFSIGESYYDPVSAVTASLDGEELEKKAFSYEYNTSDAFISDYKLHNITFPRATHTGQRATYSFRRDYKSIEFTPLLDVSNVDYIKECKVTISHPAELRIQFDIYFTRGEFPYSIDTSNAQQTVLRFTNTSRSLPLEYFPFNDDIAYIRIQIDAPNKEVTPSTPQSFAAWYQALFNQKPVLDSAHASLLAEAIAAAPTKRAKVAVIHDYVRKNIRYIAEEHGMNAIVPRPPSTVLQRGYGDCKDKAFLVASLARQHGIDGVYMALINTEPAPAFKGLHVNSFNHVICAMDDSGTLVFFDPTHKYSEFGNTPESDIDRPTLVIDPSNPRIVVVPRPNTQPEIDAVISANIDLPGTATAVITLRNSALSSALHALDNKQGMDIENTLSGLITRNFHKISFDNFTLQSRSDTAIVFTAHANLSSFIITSPTKKYLPHLPFRTVSNGLLERDNDTSGLYLSFRDNYALTINLTAEGYSTEAASIAIGDTTATGFTASSQSSAAGIVLRYRYNQATKAFSYDKKRAFIALCRDVLKAKKSMFVFNRK